ncbi:acyl carrier protein [Streptomyces sp. NPDC002669]|uniref:acyl carrier protein n=1 Tax=unclassified Streptomyces TaxID=2593676 RepID=UPI0036B6AF21
MTQDPVPEQLAWLQHVLAERLDMEVRAGDRPRDLGLDSIDAVPVGGKIHRRYGIPLRVSWEWLMTLTTEEIAAQLASASAEPGQGPHSAGS